MLYIPQAPPFVMISELVSYNEEQIITRFTVPSDNLFVEHGKFTEPGLIENMAQSVAAGQGKAAAESDAEPPIGFIGQIKNLKIYGLPSINQTITTTILIENKIMQTTLVKGRITCEEKLLAEANYRIFLQD